VARIVPKKLWCLLASVALFAANSADAQTYRYIDAESATINASSLSLTDNGRAYVHIKKGDFTTPWISPSQHWKDSHAIGFDMLPSSGTGSDGSTTDKSNFRVIAGSEADALGFTQDRYTGFAIRLETNFQTPDKEVQLFQWWQGSPFSPPLELRVRAGSMTWELVYRNDELGRGPSAARVVASGPMSTGGWYRFIVKTRMNYSSSQGSGNVTVWLNGSQVGTRDGNFGYNPYIDYPYNNPACPSGYCRANAKFDIFFGLYRPRQAKRHKAFFDQVRFGTSYAAVNPDQ
jgi:hypothetical protein